MAKTVQIELSVSKIVGAVTTVAALAAVIFGVSRWVFNAETSHAETMKNTTHIHKLDDVVADIHNRQSLDEALWGPEYRDKIREILEEESDIRGN